MYTHPDNAAKLAGDRHRDLRADIGSHRLARQLRDLASAARRARVIPARCVAPGTRSCVRAPTPDSTVGMNTTPQPRPDPPESGCAHGRIRASSEGPRTFHNRTAQAGKAGFRQHCSQPFSACACRSRRGTGTLLPERYLLKRFKERP
jgi:hypothetical protein